MRQPPRVTTEIRSGSAACSALSIICQCEIAKFAFGRGQKMDTALLSTLLLLLTAVGCGRESRLDVAPVRGRVTFSGQGVPKATVIFFPAEDAAGKAKKMRPFAYADGQGNFELKTYVDGDGAPPGKYRVSIIAVSSTSSGRPGKDAPAGEESAPAAAIVIPMEVSRKYGNVETSGIEVTVHEGENNLPPFELKAGA
jgi:hypothetical protein